MENKNKNSNTSSSENNSNPFPKLKPTGSIYIHQIPIESDNKSSQNNSNKTQEKEEKDFLSKLRVFDPNAKINTNNYNDIKHSKTFKPSTSVFNKEINKDNMYEIKEDENEKEIDEVLNINKERELLSKNTQQNETGNNNDNKKDIIDPLRLSAKNAFNSVKGLFSSLSGYLNENVINKINFNFNKPEENKEKTFANSINIDENFEKPQHFEEIEKIWNYEKILLEYNILDITSKLYL